MVTPYHDNGLFANILQVCDAVLLTKAGVPVLVDWRRKGSEGHFQYGPEGFDLWTHLFEASERCHSAAENPKLMEDALIMPGRINCLFMNMLRGYLWSMPPGNLLQLRSNYAAAMGDLEPTPRIKRKLSETCGGWTDDAHLVGVHKRLACSEMVACQLSQRAPSNQEYISKARQIFTSSCKQRKIVFLATDDCQAVIDFEAAFGKDGDVQLCYRDGVKRSSGGVREDGVDNEVHRNPCVEADAEDALVDALCLAQCQELICVDSNLSIFAALKNPKLLLHALSSILPETWEEDAAFPSEAIYESYEVIFSPMVFVRKGPSTATELLGARKPGDVVFSTGRGFDGWVEIRDGGWMLVDGARGGKQNYAAGLLLKPLGSVIAGPNCSGKKNSIE